MPSRPGKFLQAVLCLAMISLAGCRRPDPPTVRLGAGGGAGVEPTILFEGFRMSAYRGTELEWDFWARSAQVYEKNQLAKAQDIRVVYRRGEKIVSTLTAGRGLVRNDTHDMQAEEHVVMISENGARILTERLHWNQSQAKIFTDLPVTVVKENSVLTGVGLEADSELKNIRVLARVKIKVRSMKELSSFAPGPTPAGAP